MLRCSAPKKALDAVTSRTRRAGWHQHRVEGAGSAGPTDRRERRVEGSIVVGKLLGEIRQLRLRRAEQRILDMVCHRHGRIPTEVDHLSASGFSISSFHPDHHRSHDRREPQDRSSNDVPDGIDGGGIRPHPRQHRLLCPVVRCSLYPPRPAINLGGLLAAQGYGIVAVQPEWPLTSARFGPIWSPAVSTPIV